MNLDNKGQLSMELIFIIGILLVVTVAISISILHENELATAMSAAKNGVIEAITIDSLAVYPEDTFNKYQISKEGLIKPTSIKLVSINYTNVGFDSGYGKEKIQFNVSVSSDSDLTRAEKDAWGERINFYLRKSIASSFNTENLTNGLYNPVFSNHYIFTTLNVKWL